MDKTPLHFEGKSALLHVIDARLKGMEASQEIHGMELPGHFSAAADAAKETSLLFGLFWMLGVEFLVALGVGWVLWKVGRSAALGWARLERLHRLIEQERWEIEHHREQEREELKELYAAKGFEGRLLEEVIDVLMADDNRLLQVMLEEELGLKLESYEHPLKQAFGAGIGALGAMGLVGGGGYFGGILGAMGAGAFVIAFSATFSAKLERNKIAISVIWNLAIGALAVGVSYFTMQMVR